YLEPADSFAPGDDLPAITSRFGHQDEFGLCAFGLDQRPRCRAADLLVRDIELGHAQGRTRAAGTKLAEGVVGEKGAAFHIGNSGTKGAVALDTERQAFDEP